VVHAGGRAFGLCRPVHACVSTPRRSVLVSANPHPSFTPASQRCTGTSRMAQTTLYNALLAADAHSGTCLVIQAPRGLGTTASARDSFVRGELGLDGSLVAERPRRAAADLASPVSPPSARIGAPLLLCRHRLPRRGRWRRGVRARHRRGLAVRQLHLGRRRRDGPPASARAPAAGNPRVSKVAPLRHPARAGRARRGSAL